MMVAALSRRLLAPLLLAAGSQAATCGDVDGGGSGSAHVADADCGEGLRYASASAALVCAGPVCDVAGNEADRGACCEAYVDLLLLAADVAYDEDAQADLAHCLALALAAHPLPSAPCHCDPLSENFIDDGTRAWIVDFEYGGMNDPMWDLGDLIIEASLSVRSNSTV